MNVRLGFWFPNPKFVKRHSPKAFLPSHHPNLYLLSEMFGLLRENRSFLYLTDGGHIENLGLYQLLRRRCRLIIVIDAEADPNMVFNSFFIKAERYARIDLGTRIRLPWYEIREATLETNCMIAEKGDTGALISRGGPHCALGTIYYPYGQDGILLYIKSSLSGDESDYVINYKRRYANFPHETTGDQFFSEEQFEAYRNLGFHATQGFFSERDEVAITATTVFAAGEVEGAVHEGKAPMPESKNLSLVCKSFSSIIDQRRLCKRYAPVSPRSRSIGAGAGLGLPIVGKLLGHSQPPTPARYAHLDADPLRSASEVIAGRIAAAMGVWNRAN